MNLLFFLTPKAEVAYLYDDFTLRQAIEKMEYHRYSSIPILNRKGEYVGTITEGDLSLIHISLLDKVAECSGGIRHRIRAMAHHKTVKGRIRFANGTSDLPPVSRRHVRAVNVAYLAAGHIAKLAHRRDIFQELVRGKLRHKPCAGHFGRDGAAGTNPVSYTHLVFSFLCIC